MSDPFKSKIFHFKKEEWGSIWNSIGRITTFLGKFIAKQKEIGSLFPSSHWLCGQMVAEIDPPTTEQRFFLELGAGSGAVTEAILKKMGPNDRLDVIECDSELAESVQQLIDQSGMASQVTVHKVYAQGFISHRKYDHILSSLPLNNFSSELVESIYAKIKELLKDTGKFTYFEYIGLGAIRCRILFFTEFSSYHDLKTILQIKKSFCKQKKCKTKEVWGNIFPARVVHLSSRE